MKIKQNKNIIKSTTITYNLNKKKLIKLKYKSQHNNSKTSFQLYQYYYFTKNNIYKQLQFLKKSTSQKNITTQFNYKIFLSNTNPTLSKYYNLNKTIY